MLVYEPPLTVDRNTLYVMGAVPEQAVQVNVTLPVPAVAVGQLGVAGAVAVTITLNEQLAVLPDASVAVQVTVVVPCAKAEPLAGVQLEVTPEQLSLTVGANVTTAVLLQVLVVILAGQAIVGAVVSLTVTVNEQLLVPPPVSMAVQVTGVVPLANVEPFVGVQVVVTDPPQALLPVTVHLTTCEQEVAVVLVVMLPGQAMVGSGFCSATVKLQELVLPQSSTAVQVTLVLPAMKPTPGCGTQTTLGTPPQLSVAVGGMYCTSPPEHTVVVPLLHTHGKVRLPQ